MAARKKIKRLAVAAGSLLMVALCALVLPVRVALAEDELDRSLLVVQPMSATNPTIGDVYSQVLLTKTQAASAAAYGKSILADTVYIQEQMKAVQQAVVDESRKIQLPQHTSTRTAITTAQGVAQKAVDEATKAYAQALANTTKLNESSARETDTQTKAGNAARDAGLALAAAQAVKDVVDGLKTDSTTLKSRTSTLVSDTATLKSRLDAARAEIDKSVASGTESLERLDSVISALSTVGSAAVGAWEAAGRTEGVALSALEASQLTRQAVLATAQVQQASLAQLSAQVAANAFPESAVTALDDIAAEYRRDECKEVTRVEDIGNSDPSTWSCGVSRLHQLEQIEAAKEQYVEIVKEVKRRALEDAAERAAEGRAEAQRQADREIQEQIREKLAGIARQGVEDAQAWGEALDGIGRLLEAIRDKLGNGEDPGIGDADGTIPGAGKVGDWLGVGQCLAPAAPEEASLCGFGPTISVFGHDVKPLSYCGDTSGFGAMKPLLGAVLVVGAIWVCGRWLLAALGVNSPDSGARA